MAVYFQLYRIGSREAATLQSVDAAICQALELPFSEDKYVCSWFDIIGFQLACGKSFQTVTNLLMSNWGRYSYGVKVNEFDQTLVRINHFLLENYTTECWYGR
jgi:hypothetical protein